ncbi:MAG: hypothetical protein K2R93_10655 [Gemmatimonadaceae bacterium]|nr:hypothetical protein [Gemmatimonadaceae bacterium]
MMSLATLAILVDAPPKWVLNTVAAVDPGARYSEALARRLLVTRALQAACRIPLVDSYTLANQALQAWRGEPGAVSLRVHPSDDVAVTVDVYRLLSALYVRQAMLASSGIVHTEPRRPRGRPRTHTHARDAIAAAQAWGLDVSLIRENLRRTPGERLRQLDSMQAFASRVRRRAPLTAESPSTRV